MTNYIGLYYPFIHFKDDAWVKLTALYWDKMGRIVPRGYQPQDSETVKQFAENHAENRNFVENIYASFTSYESGLNSTFTQLLQLHEANLRDRYGVDRRHEWPNDPQTQLAAPPGTDPNLAYIYVEKMSPELKNAFIDTGLALADSIWTEEGRVGMHPDLAFVYMTALAEEMAAARGFHPVTDETRDHLAVTGCTLERLVSVLFQNEQLLREESTEEEVEAQMATVAFESVLPRSIANVPVEKIIEFRKQTDNERAAFQAHLQSMVTGLKKIEDQDALQMHLHEIYKNQLKPQLDEYRERLHSLGIDTVVGAFNVRAILPPIVTTGMEMANLPLPTPLDPAVVAGGAIILGTLPVLRAKQKEARDLESSSPAAYLMHLEERLGPTTLVEWVKQRARWICLRV